jgi:hypothetical protein
MSSPNWSTETRLIIERKKGKNPYSFEIYNTKDYESQCFYFNIYLRTKLYKNSLANTVSKHIAGFTGNDSHSYDSIAQIHILSLYCKNYLKKKTSAKEIVKLLYKIYEYLRHNSGGEGGKTYITRKVHTLLVEYFRRKQDHKIRKDMKVYGYQNKKELISYLVKQRDKQIEDLEKQIHTFTNLSSKQRILTIEEYIEQIQWITEDIELMKKYYKEIIDRLNSMQSNRK